MAVCLSVSFFLSFSLPIYLSIYLPVLATAIHQVSCQYAWASTASASLKGSSPLYLLNLIFYSLTVWIPKWNHLVQFEIPKCFVCSFLGFSGWQRKVLVEKTKALCSSRINILDMLTQIQIVWNCLNTQVHWTLVAMTALVSKDVAIKMNLLLYRILK